MPASQDDILSKILTEISAFRSHQEATNSEFRLLLGQIPAIKAGLSEHSKQIADLKAQNEQLTQEVMILKEQSVLSQRAAVDLTNLVIAGVPFDENITPENIVKEVFRVLGLSDLSQYILSVRKLSRNDSNNTLNAAANGENTIKKASFIVSLTATSIRDQVLHKKRSKGQLSWSEIFPDCHKSVANFNIFVNKMLPKPTYMLLRQVKRKVKQIAYKYVWEDQGNIYIRKNDGEPRLLIRTETDLPSSVSPPSASSSL
ncbi:uncharacterized protein [Venturia canescens]|uniref:uncharacterized protein n=1 Tax=Venturia canescens TaxID=32260 RepID=UPI001C9BFDD8|nr:uncharacterized protein LOC122416759 [Venturia canescens]